MEDLKVTTATGQEPVVKTETSYQESGNPFGVTEEAQTDNDTAVKPLVEDDDYIDTSIAPLRQDDDDIDTSIAPTYAESARESYAATRGISPDHAAKVVNLANSTGETEAIVEENMVTAEELNNEPDWDIVEKESPVLFKVISEDAKKMALSKDDIDVLKDTEIDIRDAGFASKVFPLLMSGTANIDAGLARLPGFAWDVALYPQNILYKSIGHPEWQAKAPEIMYNNQITRYYEEQASAWSAQVERKGAVLDLIKQGDYSGAAEEALLTAVESAPFMLLVLSIPVYGVAVAAGTSGSNEMAVSMKAGEEGTGTTDYASQTANAANNALFEYIGERIFGTIPAFNRIKKAMSSGDFKIFSAKFLKKLATAIPMASGEEALGEGFTQAGQTLSPYLSGTNPKSMETFSSDMVQAMSSALIMGGGMVATSATMSGVIKQAQSKKETTLYEKVGKAANKSKTNERTPGEYKELIQQQLETNGISEVYIPVEKFDEYFQSIGIAPEVIIQDIGAIEGYKFAKETNGNIKINYADWISKMSKTKHYNALKNDVKFTQEGFTPNEAKYELEQQSKIEKGLKEEVGSSSKKIVENEDEKINRIKAEEYYRTELNKIAKPEKMKDKEWNIQKENLVISSAAYAVRQSSRLKQPIERYLEGKQALTYSTEGMQNIADPSHKAVTIQRAEADIYKIPVQDINIDAETYQFKEGGDEFGVLPKLSDVGVWDPYLADFVTLYEDKNGKLWVVDGHQRVGLAKKLMAGGHKQIEVNAIILREVDGITREDAMIKAAEKNIVNNSATLKDSAKIFRLTGGKTNLSIPNTPLVKQAKFIAKLSKFSYFAFVNDKVQGNYSAVTGELAAGNEELQDVITEVFIKQSPENVEQAKAMARNIIADVNNLVEEDGFQGAFDVFGANNKKAIFFERGKILTDTIKDLAKDKKIFNSLINNNDDITRVGNELKKETNKDVVNKKAMAIDILGIEANTVGSEISAKLSEFAKELKKGGKKATIIKKFKTFLSKKIEEGYFDKVILGKGEEASIKEEAILRTESLITTKTEVISKPESKETITRETFVNKDTGRQTTEIYLVDEKDIPQPAAKELKQPIDLGTVTVNANEDVADEEELFQFGGYNAALTANRDMFFRANDLENQKVDSETIRQETGWVRGADKEWRFEISDFEAYMKLSPEKLESVLLNSKKPVVLSDILGHDNLYAAYPEIANIEIVVSLNKGNAVYMKAKDGNPAYIGLSFDAIRDGVFDGALIGLLHEIQHDIQKTEGFAPGGSFEKAKAFAPATLEKDNVTFKGIIDNIKRLTEEPNENTKLLIKNEIKKIVRLFKKYDLNYSDYISEEIVQGKVDLTRVKVDDIYMSFAGEIEARHTASRMNLTEEERRQIPPNFNPEDKAIVWDGVESDLTYDLLGGDTIYYPGSRTEEGVNIVGKFKNKDVAVIEAIDIPKGIENREAAAMKAVKNFEDWAQGQGAQTVELQDKIEEKLLSRLGYKNGEKYISSNTLFQSETIPEYMGSHEAPTNDGYSKSLNDMQDIYPEDIYSSNGARYYGDGHPYDQAAISIFNSVRGKPNAPVKIYRAVPKVLSNSEKINEYEKQKAYILKTGKIPKSVTNWDNKSEYYDFISNEIDKLKDLPETTEDKFGINAGDWVTISREYSKEHGKSTLNGQYKIISKTVKASEVFTDGNSIHEQGYDPNPKTLYQDNVTEQGVPLFQGAKVDDYKFGNKRRAKFEPIRNLITFLKDANASSGIHETGHYWLEDIFDIVNSGIATPEFVDDWNIVKEYLGIKEGQEKITREQHEKFAKSVEAYFREGTAPSSRLKEVFENFKAWLLDLYKSIKAIGLENNISDDMRGVFDRLLATEEEINAAKGDMRETDPNIYGEGVASKIRELQNKSTEEAKVDLLAEQMKESTKKYSLLIKKEESDARDRIEKDTENNETYRASKELSEAFNGQNAKELADMFIAGTLTEEQKNIFDDIALINAYPSGGNLAQVIADSPSFEEFVGQQLQEYMSKFAPMKDTNAIKEEAMKLAHNETSSEAMFIELSAIEQLNKGTRPKDIAGRLKRDQARRNAKFAKIKAKEILDNSILKDATAFLVFSKAEIEAAKKFEKAMARKDFKSAMRWKQSQILNHALVRQALENKKEIAVTERYIKKITKKTDDLKRSPYAFNKHINNIMANVGMAQLQEENIETMQTVAQNMEAEQFEYNDIANATGLVKTEGGQWKEESLADFVTRQNDNYSLLQLPKSVIFQKQTPYKQLTVKELRDVKNSVKAIDKLGRNLNSFISNYVKGNIKEAGAEFRKQVEANWKSRYAERRQIGTKKGKGKFKKLLERVGDIPDVVIMPGLVNVLNICEILDLSEKEGLAKTYIYRPFAEAEAWKINRKSKVVKDMNEIIARHFKNKSFEGLEKTSKYFPEIERELTNDEVLSMILNQGNQTNKDRLLAGYGLTQEQVDSIINTAPRNYFDFAQDVWKYYDTFWGEIVALEMKAGGFEPVKVQPTEVVTKYGIYEGGYHPISYDIRKSVEAYKNAEERNALYKQYSTVNSMTEHGHTTPRLDYVKRPLNLSTDVIFNHLENVTHDLAYRAAVIDVNRFLNDVNVKEGIINAIGNRGYTTISKWVKAIAADQNENLNGLDTGIRWLRFKSTYSNLAFKTINFPLDLTSNAANAMWELGEIEFANAIRDFIGNPAELIRTINSKSPRMKERATYRDRDLNNMRNKWKGKEGKLKTYAFVTMALSDQIMSYPSWWLVYSKNAGKLGEAKAVNLANEMVTKTFSSGSILDQVAWQRGSEAHKIWTWWYTWSSMMFNRVYLSGKMAQSNLQKGDYTKTIAILARAAVYGWVIQSINDNFWREFLRNSDDDDEEARATRILSRTLTSPLQYVPIAREVGGYAINKAIGSYARIGLPALSTLETVSKTAGNFGKMMFDEDFEMNQRFVEDLAATTSIMFGYSKQFNIAAFNLLDVINDEGELSIKDLFTRKIKE